MPHSPSGQNPRLTPFLHGPIPWLAIIFVLVSLTVGLQLTSGAYRSELAHVADETAHVVSALMVHDYLRSGFEVPPIEFAERYYGHYPKVAIGWWPPLFHCLAGAWMLLFGVSRPSLLMFTAMLSSALACCLAFYVKRHYGAALGFAAGLIFVLTYWVRLATGVVMLDLPVALGVFAGMMALEAYFRTGKDRYAILLGLATSAAMLTKGSGAALAVASGFMLLLTGRWDLLRSRGLYLACAIVVILGVPWQLVSVKLQARNSLLTPLDAGQVVSTIAQYARFLFEAFTPAVSCLLLAGLVRAFRRPHPGEDSWLSGAAAASLLLGVITLQGVAPMFGALFDPRFATAAIAPGIVLFVEGCRIVAGLRLWPVSWQKFVLATLIGGALLSGYFLGAYRPVNLRELGYIRATDLALRANGPCCTMLISSDSNGEGAFISEAALNDRRLSRVVLRGSKLISESPWNGRTYRMLFQDEASLSKALEVNAVDVVVVDHTKTDYAPARNLLLAALHRKPGEWRAELLPGDYTRNLELFTRVQPAGLKRTMIEVPMRYSFGRDIRVKLP